MADPLPPTPLIENEEPPLTQEQKRMQAAMTTYYQTSVHPGDNFLSVLAVAKGIRSGAIITVYKDFQDSIKGALFDVGLFAVVYPVVPRSGEVNLILLNRGYRNLIPELAKIKKANISIENRNRSTGKVLGYVTPRSLSEVGNVRTSGRVEVVFRGPRGKEIVAIAPQKIVGNPEEYRDSFEVIQKGLLALELPPGFRIESAEVKLSSLGGSRTRKRYCSKKSKSRRRKN